MDRLNKKWDEDERDRRRYKANQYGCNRVADNYDYDKDRKTIRDGSPGDALKALGSSMNAIKTYYGRNKSDIAAKEIVKREKNGTLSRSNKDDGRIHDAVDRHNRRHPDRKLEGVQNLREYYEGDYDAYSEEY